MRQRQAQQSCMGRSSKSPWWILWIVFWSTIWWVPWTAESWWKFYIPILVIAAFVWFLANRYGRFRRSPQVIYTPPPQQPVYYQPPELPSYREGYQEQRQFVADNAPYTPPQEQAPLQWDDEQPQAQYPEMKQPPA